jgi:sterol desaturase/sphingolipid hydroxylase (fatty acid hydroxylase superfamily)
MKVDLTVLAIPGFIGAMAAEYAWQRRHPAPAGTTRTGDYELADTIASLTMGVGSLVAPLVWKRLLDPVTPGVGRHAKALVGTAVAATAVTSVADIVRRRYAAGGLPEPGTVPTSGPFAPRHPGSDAAATPRHTDSPTTWWRRLHGGAAATAVGATALAAATTWTAQTSGQRLFATSSLDLGTGVLATAVGILGWDFIYYWNHRLDHESRWLWAMHVVHHSSERYNLSTALRQPVAEGLTMSVPYGLLALLGIRPSVIEDARALNLIYQFWIHTEVVRSIGWLENILNTPSHHRVHHGSNRQYLDRNHGSILIVWDRLFGTFEREDEAVVYGLTTNIDTFNPVRIATHEWRDILADIAGAGTWRDRWSYLLRGPGWAYTQRAERAEPAGAVTALAI